MCATAAGSPSHADWLRITGFTLFSKLLLIYKGCISFHRLSVNSDHSSTPSIAVRCYSTRTIPYFQPSYNLPLHSSPSQHIPQPLQWQAQTFSNHPPKKPLRRCPTTSPTLMLSSETNMHNGGMAGPPTTPRQGRFMQTVSTLARCEVLLCIIADLVQQSK
jgi:hypothetical protein